MVVYFSFCYTVCYREVIELKELEVEVGVEWGFWWGCFFFILQVGEIVEGWWGGGQSFFGVYQIG